MLLLAVSVILWCSYRWSTAGSLRIPLFASPTQHRQSFRRFLYYAGSQILSHGFGILNMYCIQHHHSAIDRKINANTAMQFIFTHFPCLRFRFKCFKQMIILEMHFLSSLPMYATMHACTYIIMYGFKASRHVRACVYICICSYL